MLFKLSTNINTTGSQQDVEKLLYDKFYSHIEYRDK